MFFIPCLSQAIHNPGRFFYEGDGFISLTNSHNGKKVSVQYRLADGTYDAKALDQINLVFGMSEQELGEGVSLRLIAMLDYLEDKFSPGKTLKLISAYRSPKYNQQLRSQGKLAAQTSYHINGMAADVEFPGAKVKEIWEYVKSLNCCGVGDYGGNYVHLDSGKPRFWDSKTAIPEKEEPQENKNIYLAPDLDTYHTEETMRLFFSGVSDYPFGVKPTFNVVKGDQVLHSFQPQFKGTTQNQECMTINTFKESRHIHWTIPKNFKNSQDQLNIAVEFCGFDYKKMPKKILSKPFIIR